MLDDQARHLAYIISEATARGAVTVETSAEGEAQWVETVHDLANDNSAFWEACTPGNYNNEGRIQRTISSEAYAPGVNAFNALLEAWRENGKLEGMVLGFQPDSP